MFTFSPPHSNSQIKVPTTNIEYEFGNYEIKSNLILYCHKELQETVLFQKQ